MPRVQPKLINSTEKEELLDNLWLLVSTLQTKDEIGNFFKNLLSETEAVMLARRIQIAQLLLEGESYRGISNRLHASEMTVAKVHRWLQLNIKDYSKIVSRFEKELSLIKKGRRQKVEPEIFSFEWLKKRYPLHFLLFNLLEKNKNNNKK